MTIPDGYVIFVKAVPFFLIEMLRPHEDVPGNYLESRVWHWSLYALSGTKVSWGYVKNRGTCKSSAKRAALSYLKRNELRQGVATHTTLKMTEQRIQAVEEEVKMLLHASRDCLRNKGIDTGNVAFVASDGYYGEAFGVMRALALLGAGNLGAVNTPENKSNLRWWFYQLEQQVLNEEHFSRDGTGSNKCDHCLERYGKDGAGRGRES